MKKKKQFLFNIYFFSRFADSLTSCDCKQILKTIFNERRGNQKKNKNKKTATTTKMPKKWIYSMFVKCNLKRFDCCVGSYPARINPSTRKKKNALPIALYFNISQLLRCVSNKGKRQKTKNFLSLELMSVTLLPLCGIGILMGNAQGDQKDQKKKNNNEMQRACICFYQNRYRRAAQHKSNYRAIQNSKRQVTLTKSTRYKMISLLTETDYLPRSNGTKRCSTYGLTWNGNKQQ